MEPTPTEAAAIEQQQREAAFTRARAKLAATRVHREHGRKAWSYWLLLATSAPAWSIGCVLLGVGVIAFIVLSKKPVLVLPNVFEGRDGLLLSALLVGVACYLGWKLLAWSKQSSAERMVRMFYRIVGRGDTSGRVFGSGHCVIAGDFDLAPRRPPAFNQHCGLPQLIESESDLDSYWTRLTAPKAGRARHLKVRRVQITPIADDLLLAQVTIQPWRTPFLWSSAFAAVVLVPLVIVMEQEWLHRPDVSWLVRLALVLGPFLALVAAKRLGNEGKPLTTQKLLIRCDDQWRMFCGDWEGWEERDLSWLDDPSTQPPSN